MFNIIKPAGWLVSIVLVTGCAISHPQTADEFRKAVPGAMTAKSESFEVNRPIAAVTSTFQKMAPQCLHKRVTTTSSGYMHYQVIETDYNPTVKVSKERTELHLQQDHTRGVMHVSKKPAGGYYLLVADATPIASNKSRIDMYYPSMGFDHVVAAIRGWATGEKPGCPDLTK